MKRDRRLGDEVRFHRDRLIEDYIAAGMDRKEAERLAFLEFGNVAQIEEACRDVRRRPRTPRAARPAGPVLLDSVATPMTMGVGARAAESAAAACYTGDQPLINR